MTASVIRFSAAAPPRSSGADYTVTPATIACVVAVIEGSGQSLSQTVHPAPIRAEAAVPTPAFFAGVNYTVTPATIACVAAMPAVAVSGDWMVFPATILVTTGVPSGSLTSESVLITPATIAAVVTVPTSVFEVNYTVTPATIACVAAMPAMNIVGGSSWTVSPTTIACTVTMPAVLWIPPVPVVLVRLVYTGAIDDHERPDHPLWRRFHAFDSQKVLFLYTDGTVVERPNLDYPEYDTADAWVGGGILFEALNDDWRAVVLAANGYILEPVPQEVMA